MCSYSSYKKCKVIVAFDAYKRAENDGSVEHIGDVRVVYTKEHETADSYIEKTVASLAEKNTVRVVTNDRHEQLMVLGSGALRVSSREFADEIAEFSEEIREIIESIK